MEETAYILNLTINSKMPVIMTDAMCPATAVRGYPRAKSFEM